MNGVAIVADFAETQSAAVPPHLEAQSSGVAWGAVTGGAFVTAALYLILLSLGAGLGLSAVSPWTSVGVAASTAGAVAIIWLIVIEIIAAAFGGYLTGRLRTKWARIHTDEVFFRDTANGFLAWSVALVVSMAFLASAAAFMAGSSEGARAQTGTNTTNSSLGTNAYFVDALFRSDRSGPESRDSSTQAEAGRILNRALLDNQMADTDHEYLARLVAMRTGLNQQDAEKRVSDVVANARLAEDTARKAASHLLLWLFLSMLMGAFSASYAAAIGGRQRDRVAVV